MENYLLFFTLVAALVVLLAGVMTWTATSKQRQEATNTAIDKLIDLLKKGLALGCLAVLAYLGESGKDGGFIKDIWSAAKTASPFAAMFAVMAWLSERTERRMTQQQCQDRTISFVEATNAQSNALEQMVEVVKRLGDALKSRRRRE